MDQEIVAFARSWAMRYVRTKHPHGLDEGDVENRSLESLYKYSRGKMCGRDGARPSRVALLREGRAPARPQWRRRTRRGASLPHGPSTGGPRSCAAAMGGDGRAGARPSRGRDGARPSRVALLREGRAPARPGASLPTLGVRPPYVGGLASLRLEKTFPPLRVQGADARERVPPADATGTLGTRGTWGADAQERVPPALPGGGAIAAYGKCGRKTDGVIGCVVSLPAGIMV